MCNCSKCYTGDTLVVRPYEKADHNQQWERTGEFIKSRTYDKKALDIYGKFIP